LEPEKSEKIRSRPPFYRQKSLNGAALNCVYLVVCWIDRSRINSITAEHARNKLRTGPKPWEVIPGGVSDDDDSGRRRINVVRVVMVLGRRIGGAANRFTQSLLRLVVQRSGLLQRGERCSAKSVTFCW
jgi:hypothetical protein